MAIFAPACYPEIRWRNIRATRINLQKVRRRVVKRSTISEVRHTKNDSSYSAHVTVIKLELKCCLQRRTYLNHLSEAQTECYLRLSDIHTIHTSVLKMVRAAPDFQSTIWNWRLWISGIWLRQFFLMMLLVLKLKELRTTVSTVEEDIFLILFFEFSKVYTQLVFVPVWILGKYSGPVRAFNLWKGYL